MTHVKHVLNNNTRERQNYNPTQALETIAKSEKSKQLNN